MFRSFWLIIIFFSFRAIGQQTNYASEIQKIIAQIDEDNFVLTDTIGMFGNLPNDHPLKRLYRDIPKKMLIDMTNDSNPKVRCSAFKALTIVDESSAFLAVKQHLNDTAVVQSKYGCFSDKGFVGDYFINVFRGFDAANPNPYHLAELDSLILFTSNKLDARDGAVRRAGAKRKYYEKVRALAMADNLFGAAFALALFKQDADANIIIRAMDGGNPDENLLRGATIVVTSNFTHPAFMPVLENNLNAILLKPGYHRSTLLFTAIAKYENDQSRNLLERVFAVSDKQKRHQLLKDLSLALSKNDNPLYAEIRKRLASAVRN